MSNGANTSWLVSVMKWERSGNGSQKVVYCSSRSFRREEYARGQYDTLLESLEEQGYKFVPIASHFKDGCEGRQGSRPSPVKGSKKTLYAAVYLDRNPVYSHR